MLKASCIKQDGSNNDNVLLIAMIRVPRWGMKTQERILITPTTRYQFPPGFEIPSQHLKV
jgi:hypothetical protein